MENASGLKVEYVKPKKDVDPKEEHKRLVRFVTLFAQVGFQELFLNPETSIDIKNYQ